MQGFILTIDRFSVLVGKLFAWAIMALTLVIVYEVSARYLFRAPTSWAYDVSYMLYGMLFLCAGAYTMTRNGHVRADFIYRNWSPTMQARVDLLLFIFCFFPGMLALVFYGWSFFLQSFLQNERSNFGADGPLIWPYKFFIPAVGALMILQGLAECARCIVCLRAGAWPPRLHDVEELENLMLAKAAAERGEDVAR